MQGVDPPAGPTQRDVSRTESEGHLSAASFIDYIGVHLPGQNRCSQPNVTAFRQANARMWVNSE